MIDPEHVVSDNFGFAFKNVHLIDIEVVSELQNDLEPYDIYSLVFLLYEVPETAFQRLILLQRVVSDNNNEHLNFLYDWAIHAQARSTWRYELLEALTLCQLNRIICKLNLDVNALKQHFLPDNLHTYVYINPMKKALYKICENMKRKELDTLKDTLMTYNYDSYNLETCEQIFLMLMCDKFIMVKDVPERNSKKYIVNIENLAKVIENIQGIKQFAREIREIERRCNSNSEEIETTTSEPTTSTESKNIADYKNIKDKELDQISDSKFINKLNKNTTFEILNKLEGLSFSILKTKPFTSDDSYPIKDPKEVGVCLIINQEKFFTSKTNADHGSQLLPLPTRHGSSKDKTTLNETMRSLNFDVITADNLDAKNMIDFIKKVMRCRVYQNHSIFLLCILSHGTKGCVYAADSVKVNIEYIENLMDSCEAEYVRFIPKVIVLQACQVNDEESNLSIVADSPHQNFVKKADLLTYYATAPELEAYRDENCGSVFIQILCSILKKCANEEHLTDICTKVNDKVVRKCSKLKKDQVPQFKSSLRKKLFLQVPFYFDNRHET